MPRRIFFALVLVGAAGLGDLLVADDARRSSLAITEAGLHAESCQRARPSSTRADVPPAMRCPASPIGSGSAAGWRLPRRSARSTRRTFRPIRPTASGAGPRRNFVTAVTQGISPAGAHYFPAFPYTSYAHARIEDIRDLFAYLKTLAPVAGKVRDHDVPFPFNIRRNVGIWKLLFMDDKPFAPDAARSRAMESRRLSRQQPRPLRGVSQPAQFPRRHRRRAALCRRPRSGRRGLGAQHHAKGIWRLERKGYRLFSRDRANARWRQRRRFDGRASIKNTSQLERRRSRGDRDYLKSLPPVDGAAEAEEGRQGRQQILTRPKGRTP